MGTRYLNSSKKEGFKKTISTNFARIETNGEKSFNKNEATYTSKSKTNIFGKLEHWSQSQNLWESIQRTNERTNGMHRMHSRGSTSILTGYPKFIFLGLGGGNLTGIHPGASNFEGGGGNYLGVGHCFEPSSTYAWGGENLVWVGGGDRARGV